METEFEYPDWEKIRAKHPNMIIGSTFYHGCGEFIASINGQRFWKGGVEEGDGNTLVEKAISTYDMVQRRMEAAGVTHCLVDEEDPSMELRPIQKFFDEDRERAADVYYDICDY
jgi:hypothetical protein